jgi:AraC-like DNA-binding protein
MEDLTTSFYYFKESMFDKHDLPQQLEDGGIFICLHGEADFFLDLKHYRLKTGDMCVAFPASILQPIHRSDDFEGFGIGANLEQFNNIQLPSSMDYYLYIKDNPCMSLTQDEQKVILESCQLMIQKSSCRNHPFLQEITKSLFRVVYCEIAAVYKKSPPITQEMVSRKEFLVRKFMFLLTKKYTKHRDVDYYAQKLCITPRYLSSVIKEKTGNGASFWINDMIIKKAKSLLYDNKLSIMQISDELCFPNPSFFGQYFKKHTGMTPKKFRDSNG